jgi:4'-phosphopantetheinyl transferase
VAQSAIEKISTLAQASPISLRDFCGIESSSVIISAHNYRNNDMKSEDSKTNAATLLKDDIHVWKVWLNFFNLELKNFWELLSSDEKTRAERFKFDIHRERFIASRGILRTLLGKYLQIQPQEINFRYTAHGKPYLDHNTDLFFNASDSQNLAIYALTLNREIGVDVEYMKKIDYLGIAERFFSPNEFQVLKNLPEDQKKQAFFNCWTRKEAFIKAIGEGLSFPLSDFNVSLVPGEAAMLIDIRGDKKAAQAWTMQSLDLADDYSVALVAEGKINNLLCFQYNLD